MFLAVEGAGMPNLGLPELFAGSLVLVWILWGALIFLLCVLWLFVPFALFGIKKRLDRIAEALEGIRDRPLPGKRPGEDVLIHDEGPDIFRTGRLS